MLSALIEKHGMRRYAIDADKADTTCTLFRIPLAMLSFHAQGIAR
jgi:hypothetical protein